MHKSVHSKWYGLHAEIDRIISTFGYARTLAAILLRAIRSGSGRGRQRPQDADTPVGAHLRDDVGLPPRSGVQHRWPRL